MLKISFENCKKILKNKKITILASVMVVGVIIASSAIAMGKRTIPGKQ